MAIIFGYFQRKFDHKLLPWRTKFALGRRTAEMGCHAEVGSNSRQQQRMECDRPAATCCGSQSSRRLPPATAISARFVRTDRSKSGRQIGHGGHERCKAWRLGAMLWPADDHRPQVVCECRTLLRSTKTGR